MGLFKKKPDPISDRARALTDQIAALEEQIKQLAAQPTPVEPSPTVLASAPVRSPAPAQSQSQPRLRSTARPQGQNVPARLSPPAAAQEPIFEVVARNPFKGKGAADVPTPADHFNELGVRKYDLAAFWRRLKNHFRGPATSNPKLVSYLAAGSIQGLRPLRYEKRVARNRLFVLVVALILVLWGIIAMFVKS